jgi:hypothetical protein
LRLATIDAELFGQTEGADTIDNSEIDRLGRATLFVGHHLREKTEHLAGRAAMDILASGKGLLERRLVCHMGEDA